MKKILVALILTSIFGIIFSILMPSFEFSVITAFNVLLSSIAFFIISSCLFITFIKSPMRLNFAIVSGGITILLFPLIFINSEFYSFLSTFILGLIVIQVVKTIDLFFVDGKGIFNTISRISLWSFTLLILFVLLLELSSPVLFNLIYSILSIGTISLLIHSFKEPLTEK